MSRTWLQWLTEMSAEQGFPSFHDWMLSHPDKSYTDFGREIDCPLLELQKAHLESSRAEGRFLEGVAHCLARNWAGGPAGIGRWIVLMRGLGAGELEPAPRVLRDELQPEPGWVPATGRDPLIQRALELAPARGYSDPAPGGRYRAEIEPMWNRVTVYYSARKWLSGLKGFTPEQGRLFALHYCHTEILNGGFFQFFWNSSGIVAPEALEGYEMLGLRDCADLLQRALAFFGEPFPRDRKQRMGCLPDWPRNRDRQYWDPFCELDYEYYAAVSEDRFERVADAFTGRPRLRLIHGGRR